MRTSMSTLPSTISWVASTSLLPFPRPAGECLMSEQLVWRQTCRQIGETIEREGEKETARQWGEREGAVVKSRISRASYTASMI